MKRLVLSVLLFAACGSDGGGNPMSTPDGGGSCEADVTTDVHNCGRCGHDCIGGACMAGQCQPVNIATAGQSHPTTLAMDSNAIYWAESPSGTDSSIMRLAKAGGGQPTSIGTVPSMVYVIATNEGGSVFVQTSNDIFQVDKQGGAAAHSILTSGIPLNTLAVDDVNLYWGTSSNQPDAGVLKRPIAGGVPTTLVTGLQSVYSLKVADGFLYFASGTGFVDEPTAVMKVSTNGGATTTLAGDLHRAVDVAIDREGVYFTVHSVDSIGLPVNDGSIMKVGLDGTGLTTLAPNQTAPVNITVAAGQLYWTNRLGNNVSTLPTSGGTAQILAANRGLPIRVLADDVALYWIDFNTSTIVRLAR